MTPQHDALYAAICAHPDEDTPRLAFADLIEEDGDSDRAAFIRKQIELSRAPEYDAAWVKCRQFDFNTVSGWGMMHTLPKLPAGFSFDAVEFRRGFPWKAGVASPAALDSGGELFAAAPIQALEIDDRSRPDFAALAAWPHLARVRRLDFSLYRLGQTAVEHLGGSALTANLRELSFSANAITAEALELLTPSALFRQLEVFELRNASIAPALLVDALAAARRRGNLRALSLAHNRITQYDAPHLFALPLLRDLERLDLEDNRLDVDGVTALAESGVVRGLRVLNLAKTLPGVPGVEDLLGAGGMAGLRSLNLANNRLGPVAAKLIAESPAARGLRVLNLSGNPIQKGGVAALAASRHLSGLVELDVGDAGAGDAGAVALAESPHLGGLIRLNLRNSTGTGRPLGRGARAALEARFGPRVVL